MIFNTEYYNTLDRGYYSSKTSGYVDFPEPVVQETNLTPLEVGSSEADIGQGTPLQKLQASIRQGSAKMEFTFFGKGKSGGGQHTPESLGRQERAEIRELSNINDVKFTVHATPNMGGASGLTREGFSEEARVDTLREINKAIEFAGDATTGGAVVFHTGEWQRPFSDIKGGMFKAYKDEDKRSPVMVVDQRTGEVQAFRKDHTVFEPKFHTAASYEKEISRKVIGTRDKNGNIVNADDWVDIDGNAIKREWLIKPEYSDKLFNRVPVWNKEETNFVVEEKKYEDFEKEAKKYNVAPEVLFMKSQIANQVLQAKGQSLYHAKEYAMYKEHRDAYKKALDFYEKLDKNTPEDEKWRLMTQEGFERADLVPPKNVPIKDYLAQKLKHVEDSMRYIHETSASADAQAKQAEERMNRISTLQDFGLSKTRETIAEAGMNAMLYSQKNKKDLKAPIYIAPENFMPEMYGSQPDEIRKIITESRSEMTRILIKQKGYGESEAKKLAETHIKGTLDTGHFNMWRKYFQAKEGESPEKAEKRFEKWYLDETEKLAKEGIIGHVHLSDNFGYDDEHITPGQGNVPMKEFIKRMEQAGLKDFIVERGGDNPDAMWHFLSDMGSPVYSLGRRMNMGNVRHGHFGYNAPPNYIVGAYSPSNEFRLWSEVPLE